MALGAVVAPPDAVAATAIARKVGMPRRIVTILEGESLVNDATALVCLRAAIAGDRRVRLRRGDRGRDFLLAAGGGLAVGIAAAYVLTELRKRIRNVAINTSTSLIAPLVAYLPAEAIHASGVLAVVVTGLIMGTKAPSMPNGAARLSQRSNWDTVQFLLENSVFLLIGLQVRTIIEGVRDDSLGAGPDLARLRGDPAGRAAPAPGLGVSGNLSAPAHPGRPPRNDPAPPWQFPAIVSWAGMRGVVTLAAVLVLPAELEHRSVLILAALVVVAGTLTLQGFTLPALVRLLRVAGPGPARGRPEPGLADAAGHGRRGASGCRNCARTATRRRSWRCSNGAPRSAAWRRGSGWAGPRRRPPRPASATPSCGWRCWRPSGPRSWNCGAAGSTPTRSSARSWTGSTSRSPCSTPAWMNWTCPPAASGEGIARPGGVCEHLEAAPDPAVPPDAACAECLREGTTTVHLRMCLACGNVACCDSSPGTHASKHFQASGHPVMRSIEPGEDWRWCYADELLG